MSFGWAQPPQRLRANISDGETFRLKGNTRPAVVSRAAIDQGAVAASHEMPRMSLHFALTAAQQADLERLLRAQQDRRSAEYHKFLTPEQFAERFGLNNADLAKVSRWLENSGFRDLQIARSHMWVSFSGTAANAEAAFHTPIHQYSVRGEMHFANADDPQLPKTLQGVVQGVGGLHNFAMRAHPRSPHPNYTSSVTGKNYLVPDDWATIYDVQPLYGAGFDGTGVTIAIMGQSDVLLSDIAAFRAAVNLPVNAPSVVVPPGDADPGLQSSSGDETESDLDLEWAGGIAKNAHILFVTASATLGNGVQDSMRYAIDNNVAPIISTSYSNCEADVSTSDFNTETALYQQAVAQGITIVAASGDWGAAGCDSAPNETVAKKGLAVEFPASSQYVTGVGGTEFEDNSPSNWTFSNNSNGGSVAGYIPEMAWNDGLQVGVTGGGASKLVAKPIWQTGPSVPADGARDVPDVSFAASPQVDGFLICAEGSCVNGFLDAAGNLDVIGGTSVSAPSLAAVLALVIQSKGAATRLGNINPNLYSLAQISTNVFHDIQIGSNDVPCQQGSPDCQANGLLGYSEGGSYNQVTGLGSFDADNLTQQWFGDLALSASPTSLQIQPGASATATITVTPQNNFSGNVTFACTVSSALADVTCSVPGTVNTSGIVTVTVTAASTARTPFLKRLAIPPSAAWGCFVASCAMAALVITVLRYRPIAYRLTACGTGVCLLIVIAGVAVGCGGAAGGASSPPAGGGGATPQPPALSLSCNLPPSASTGVAFWAICSPNGGTAPYKYSISSGSLPAGLALDPVVGVISGTPTAVGAAPFTVMVTDSGSPPQTATQAAPGFTVESGPLSVFCNLMDAVVNQPYNGQCRIVGGTPPYTFSLAAPLPPGLSLNTSTGAITGVPLGEGIYAVKTVITDSGSPPRSYNYSDLIKVLPSGTSGALSLTCTTKLGNGVISGNVGALFSGGCSADNGTGLITFSISSGSLPPGLTLNMYTGSIEGRPTLAGTYSFTETATDMSSPPQTASQVEDNVVIGPRLPESGVVTVTATSGGIVNSTQITVSVP